ncbi:MAG: transcription-repair coupling factor [Dehalococcoidia bacterium]|nr:transcription-repair coupling factor [Dehalococcoidia bacterium]
MNLSFLTKLASEAPACSRLVRDLRLGSGEQAAAAATAAQPYLVAALHRELGLPTLVVVPTAQEARQFYEQLLTWCDAQSTVLLLPEDSEGRRKDPFHHQQRLKVLTALAGTSTAAQRGALGPIVVASAAAAAARTVSLTDFAASRHEIRQGDQISLMETLSRWSKMGYRREHLVEVPGTMSHRGGILDVFPPNSELPVRIELLGNRAESIRLFDPQTQRSLRTVPSVEIVAAAETAWPATDTLMTYLPNDSLVIQSDAEGIEAALDGPEAIAEEGEEASDSHLSYSDFSTQVRRARHLLTLNKWSPPGSGADTTMFTSLPSFGGQLKPFVAETRKLTGEGYRVLIVSQQAPRISEALQDEDILASPLLNIEQVPLRGSVTIIQGSLPEGWAMPPELAVFTDVEIFGYVKQPPPARRPVPPSRGIMLDLSPGDYAVHIDHGIARFRGMKKVRIGDVEREYMTLEYAAGDMLYVPTDQADRVSRYLGSSGEPPSLSRLGTQDWSRAKQRVKESAQDMAQELLKLYATREVMPGFAFSPDTTWQEELEASFPYTETPDQTEAVRQVKEDMEKPKPMDRLVCGDVGYGKTEIALRAAFKAVMDQKQVAVLVPTTVLAQQHYNTFSQRLAKYPIKVEMLSRFRSEKEQQAVIEGLKNGTVDIVIGTHRLLQKDVSFKDLGLLVIDEEQRFGVAHKERLKQLRGQVDVLTLTATPIPRTLHMSLVGVRDMSTLETPPEERLPIRTYVSDYNETLIRDAIMRELERKGQVFFVHNRVQTIGRIARRLKEIVPEAEIAYAHGQMKEDRLEAVMLDFYQGKTDVLVCTSIIESGLDIPNANTIIVDESDKLGLAQMYQLRGRIGRSSTKAYAYFMYSKGKMLTPAAEKRLQTIFEASELGAGFRIAMKDLEIRGAGNLLGAEQSGHIAAVGFDLYCQMLSEAIQQMKALQAGKEPAEVFKAPAPSVVLDLPLTAYIPESYVPDLSTRLDIYKRLAKATDQAEARQIGEELVDRFGKLPKQVENLLYLLNIKLLAGSLGVESINKQEDQIVIAFAEGHSLAQLKLPVVEKWLKVGTSQIRLDLRYLTHRWQKAIEDVLVRVRDQVNPAKTS